jgi:hypothetical protein
VATERRLCIAQNAGFSGHKPLGTALFPKKAMDDLRMKTMLAACLFVGIWTTSAGAVDLAELAPCKPAAARYCDHSGGMTWSNLLRCGATLAAHSWHVGGECRAVLRKYGQL